MTTTKTPYRNVLRSKRLIQEAYLQLLGKKAVGKIKIKELIELADVSKGTFYAHYTCLQDIRLEIEDEQLSLMFQVFDEHSPALILEDFFPLFLCGLRVMEERRALYRILFCGENERFFPHRVAKMFLDYLLSCTTNSAYFDDPQQAKNYLNYVAGGAIAVIQDWLEHSPDVPAETVAKLLSDCALGGIKGFREAAARRS